METEKAELPCEELKLWRIATSDQDQHVRLEAATTLGQKVDEGFIRRMISSEKKKSWSFDRKLISMLRAFEAEQSLRLAPGDGKFSLLLLSARFSSAKIKIKRDLVSGAQAGILGAVSGVILWTLLFALLGINPGNLGYQDLAFLIVIAFFFGGALSTLILASFLFGRLVFRLPKTAICIWAAGAGCFQGAAVEILVYNGTFNNSLVYFTTFIAFSAALSLQRELKSRHLRSHIGYTLLTSSALMLVPSFLASDGFLEAFIATLLLLPMVLPYILAVSYGTRFISSRRANVPWRALDNRKEAEICDLNQEDIEQLVKKSLTDDSRQIRSEASKLLGASNTTRVFGQLADFQKSQGIDAERLSDAVIRIEEQGLLTLDRPPRRIWWDVFRARLLRSRPVFLSRLFEPLTGLITWVAGVYFVFGLIYGVDPEEPIIWLLLLLALFTLLAAESSFSLLLEALWPGSQITKYTPVLVLVPVFMGLGNLLIGHGFLVPFLCSILVVSSVIPILWLWEGHRWQARYGAGLLAGLSLFLGLVFMVGLRDLLGLDFFALFFLFSGIGLLAVSFLYLEESSKRPFVVVAASLTLSATFFLLGYALGFGLSGKEEPGLALGSVAAVCGIQLYISYLAHLIDESTSSRVAGLISAFVLNPVAVIAAFIGSGVGMGVFYAEHAHIPALLVTHLLALQAIAPIFLSLVLVSNLSILAGLPTKWIERLSFVSAVYLSGLFQSFFVLYKFQTHWINLLILCLCASQALLWAIAATYRFLAEMGTSKALGVFARGGCLGGLVGFLMAFIFGATFHSKSFEVIGIFQTLGKMMSWTPVGFLLGAGLSLFMFLSLKVSRS